MNDTAAPLVKVLVFGHSSHELCVATGWGPVRSSSETTRMTEYYLKLRYGDSVEVEHVDLVDPAAQARFPELAELLAKRDLPFPLVAVNGELRMAGSAHHMQVMGLVEEALRPVAASWIGKEEKMALISKKDAELLRKEFTSALEAQVKLVMFTQEVECQFCRETRQITEEIASLSDKITAEIYDFVGDKAVAEKFGIDKIPAIAIVRVEEGVERDYGIRFYGIPSGYEFTTIIEDILDVSKGDSGLQPKTRQALASLTVPIHFQVFVTPTWPHCTQAVRLAHKFAIESERVRGDMVESIEFPHLANQYHVYGVPRTVINGSVHQEGAVPEPVILAKVMEAAKAAASGMA